MGFRKTDEPTPRSLTTLIGIAVRYPEISTVKYDPREQTLRLGFLVHGELSAEEFGQLESVLTETLEIYSELGQRQMEALSVTSESLGDLVSLSVIRDVSSLTPEEVYTIVEVVRDRLPGRIFAENVEPYGEDDLIAQDEMIEEMLTSLARGRTRSDLIAIREDGRVMFFYK